MKGVYHWRARLAVTLVVGTVASTFAGEPVSFNREIRPILSNNCFSCHGPDENKRKAGLRLDVQESAVVPRDGVQVIVPGDPAASELIHRITASDVDERMPPPESKKRLAPSEIDTVKRWIAQGAVYEKHWAFEPVTQPSAPPVAAHRGLRNGVDGFIEKQLEEAGLSAAAEADRYTLIRRLYLDLLGIQPSVETVDAFVHDPSPAAYERLVDRILANPHHGERWGRHWLDQARYADSDGYAPDGKRSMWPYRDWVIRALNEDMPFDRFTIEQLAGDLLGNPTRRQLVATGFHRNTLINTEGGSDAEQFRNEAVIDRTNTTGAVWMGLTLGCAQCHTHKFDPITHREYYQFFAFFDNSQDKNSRHPVLTLHSPEEKAALANLREKLAAAKAGDDPEETDIAKLEKEISALEKGAPSSMIMADRDERRLTHVHVRGDFLRKGEEVEPGVPPWLPAMTTPPEDRNRLDLARWLMDPEHPLTARVTVNRMWMHHFGTGLVETENDFGLQGRLPSHPDLLDWLASEFMRLDWSMKSIHRVIVTSAAYRRASVQVPELATVDPENRLLGRQNRPRVEAEIVRDLALSASGLLTRRIGGPSVYPPQPEGIYAFTQNKKHWQESQGEDRYRRGLYTFFYRSAPHPMLATFDTPNFQVLCSRRERSNTPLQALQVANDGMFIEFARRLAAEVLSQYPQDAIDSCVTYAFRRCLTRPPDEEELATLTAFFQEQRSHYAQDLDAASDLAGEASAWPKGSGRAEAAAWTALARVLLNLDEFVSRG